MSTLTFISAYTAFANIATRPKVARNYLMPDLASAAYQAKCPSNSAQEGHSANKASQTSL